MNVFRYTDYREVIAERVNSAKKTEKNLSFSALAEAAQVQRGYVTRVLKKEAHFNSDQLYLVSKYLQFTVTETQYVFLLLEFGRSVVNSRKIELQRQIREIQMQHRDTRKHLKAEMVSDRAKTDYDRYYLDPLAPLVHIFLSLPSYAKQPHALSARLNISESRLKKTIQTLEDLKVIQWNKNGKTFELLKDHLQLVADSPMNLPYQLFQRNNAIHKIQNQTIEDRFMFSVTFSANEQTKNEIHEEFLKFLRRTEALVKGTAAPSDVFQMNFDLFGWN